MTTQEAKIKNDIPRKEEHNKYSELYFPELRSTIFSILSGDQNMIEKITKKTNEGIKELNTEYQALKEAKQLQSDVPLQLEFTDEGFEISVIIRDEKSDSNKSKISIVQFACLDWEKDSETLTLIAKAINETVLKCTRQIPKLINNRAVFKNVNLIETNPVYDCMILVFSMYKMLGIAESLPGCYIQSLMARKRITYNMLCHTLKYNTELPEPIKTWFKQDNIVKKQDVFLSSAVRTEVQNISDGNLKPEMDEYNDLSQPQQQSQWALHLIDYTGQKFSQKLRYQYAPKRVYVNDRFINIDGDASVTG